ncbi:MAG: hypothetical protein HC828_18480 [Blastochloris sp.]|nr:hypothetical protein [Blastochloris sp.]
MLEIYSEPHVWSQEGNAAFHAGDSLDSLNTNPYEAGTEAANAWDVGWWAAYFVMCQTDQIRIATWLRRHVPQLRSATEAELLARLLVARRYDRWQPLPCFVGQATLTIPAPSTLSLED